MEEQLDEADEPPKPSPLPPPSQQPAFAQEEAKSEELSRQSLAPLALRLQKKNLLSKQLSMTERTREAAWERRRRHILRKEQEAAVEGEGLVSGFETAGTGSSNSLTDEDLNELKGSIDLGFGFNEEDGQELCETLPALDFYFAVNRQFSSPAGSPCSTPRRASTASSVGDLSSSTLDSPRSPHQYDAWKICSPGDNPQHVKTRLRHWAQAVACSVRQYS